MNRYKWIQWIALVIIMALFIAGCSKKQSPSIDPPQLGHGLNEDEYAPTVSLIDSELEETVNVSLFLQDPEGYVVPVSMEVPVPENMEIARLALEYMTVNGPHAHKLPQGFTALIPEGTQVIGMDIKQDEKLAVVDLSHQFQTYEAKEERKILEAITWTLTEFPAIDQVKLWVDGKLLKEMPIAGIPINEPLTRAMGINIEQAEGVYLGQSSPVTLYFQSQTSDLQTYFVPVTRLIEQTDDVAMAAMEQLVKGPLATTSLASTVPSNVNVLDIQQTDDLISIFLTDNILDADHRVQTGTIQALILSLTENTGATKVKVLTDGHSQVISADEVNYSQPVFRPTHFNHLAM